jgi:D-alanyl-D-alanine carboxypeptidase/D-alanyl-D-alanine-endopeptidase (penicillin-binding protein 4)
VYTLGVWRLSRGLAWLKESGRVNRLARTAVLTLALLCAFTIGAGAAVAHLLPPRLALFQMPGVSRAGLAAPGATLPAASGSPLAGRPSAGGPATPSGVTARIAGIIASGSLGPHVGALVTNLATGKVLYAFNPATGFTPASTTKLATAVAALHVLGPAARFTTSVRAGATASRIVLVGGGDPTLAAGRYPATDYPQPATLRSLAAATAHSLRAKGVTSVRLSYDDTLFGGPEQALGWPAIGASDNYISSGNVAPITGLEIDQGRLRRPGVPQDADVSGTSLRSLTPGLDAARAFARFLRRDKITVAGTPAPAAAPSGAAVIAAVSSPSLAEIVQWMLMESNNVIAETLARQVALTTGRPATFSGAAAAVMAVDRRLGVTGIGIHDGSGLSQADLITPQALIALIGLAARTTQPGLRPLITGLPVAGFSGTLTPFPGAYFGGFGPAALGTVRAKTGNLSTVAALAGIAYARNGQLLAFAFMGDQLSKKGPALAIAGHALTQLATALAGCGCR